MQWKIAQKLFAVLTLVALVTLFPYFLFAINSFEEDKTAYTYSAGIEEARHASEIFENNLSFLDQWSQLISSSLKSNHLSTELSSALKKNVEAIILYNENDFTHLIKSAIPKQKIKFLEEILGKKNIGLKLQSYDERYYLTYLGAV